MFGLAVSSSWLIAAAILFAVEALGLPGIGLFFAALAALITGLLVEYGGLDSENFVIQFAVFFLLTGTFAAALWKKMKAWRTNPSADGNFSNMVGDEAIIAAGGLTKGKRGKAKWSGTIMTAELAPQSAVEALEEGAITEIVAVKGNCLIVAPR